MKKILCILACMAITASLIACGSEPKEQTKEPQKEETTKDVDEVTPENKKENETSSEGTYKNMTFSLDPEWQYAELESGAATLVFEDQKRVATIVSVDISEEEQSDDLLLTLGLAGALNGFEDIQLREDFDITVDGKPAKGTTASFLMSGTWYAGTVLTIVADDYQYSITYIASTDSDADSEDYTSFMESIKFE